jgi:hypothetical protein
VTAPIGMCVYLIVTAFALLILLLVCCICQVTNRLLGSFRAHTHTHAAHASNASSPMEPIDDAVHQALAELRKSSRDSFILCGYEGPETTHFVLLGKGEGSASALAEFVPTNDIAYGVIRKEFLYDDTKGGMAKTNVTKFIRVVWRPESIPLKRKMKIGVLDGQIKKLLGATHSDLEARCARACVCGAGYGCALTRAGSQKGELSDAAVVELIERITQKADAVSSASGKAAASFVMAGSTVAARSAAGDKVGWVVGGCPPAWLTWAVGPGRPRR